MIGLTSPRINNEQRDLVSHSNTRISMFKAIFLPVDVVPNPPRITLGRDLNMKKYINIFKYCIFLFIQSILKSSKQNCEKSSGLNKYRLKPDPTL